MTAIVDQATQSATDRQSGVLQAIRARRSIGRVRPERPPKELIEQVLEAAVWAPNHRLTEPWRFFVLAGEAREELGELLAALQGAKLPLDAPDRQAQIDKARAKPLRAPVVIAAAVEPATGPTTRPSRRSSGCPPPRTSSASSTSATPPARRRG